MFTSVYLLVSFIAALAQAETSSLSSECLAAFQKIPGAFDQEAIKVICERAQVATGCQSVKGKPIFHFDKKGTAPAGKEKKILTLALIHGDEAPSGTVIRSWLQRLDRIDPRNTWRVIPIANPDGLDLKTRTNANGVDINRNFPSQDWDKLAIETWKNKIKDPRKFPGSSSASEPETKCLIQHFADFKPDFVISIHTPLGVLDYDGPKVQAPRFAPLPWTSLGQYPGSLGKYMWIDSKVPVLTIELKGTVEVKKLEAFDQLQDITGTIAIQAYKLLKAEKPKSAAKPKDKNNSNNISNHAEKSDANVN